MATALLPGLKLSEAFYHEAIRPLLEQHFPGLPHAAALIGSGSEVLGFDDALSTDHHFGPRAMLFLSPADHLRHADALDALLAPSFLSALAAFPPIFRRLTPATTACSICRRPPAIRSATVSKF